MGDLAWVAALTDATVLLSFMLVNLSLAWVARRGGPRAARRGPDLVLPSLALVMCGWLLVHTGARSIAVAAGLALAGFAVGRWRIDEDGGAAPAGP